LVLTVPAGGVTKPLTVVLAPPPPLATLAKPSKIVTLCGISVGSAYTTTSPQPA
jgi:hypothetical protein